MTSQVANHILGLIPSTLNVSSEQRQGLIAGWRALFFRLKLTTPEEQMREFDAIMRARVRAGSISIVAEGGPLL